MERLDDVCKTTRGKNVTLLVDVEECFLRLAKMLRLALLLLLLLLLLFCRVAAAVVVIAN
jgi:hypothetical protein